MLKGILLLGALITSETVAVVSGITAVCIPGINIGVVALMSCAAAVAGVFGYTIIKG